MVRRITRIINIKMNFGQAQISPNGQSDDSGFDDRNKLLFGLIALDPSRESIPTASQTLNSGMRAVHGL
jgi:hypothetical protein